MFLISFQEIVPLNAGNVLVIEDNGTAAKWLSLISQSLNKSFNSCSLNKTNYPLEAKPLALRSVKSIDGNSLFYQRTSLKTASKIFRAESRKRLKSCNCCPESARKYSKESCFKWQQSNNINEDDLSSDEEEGPISVVIPEIPSPAGGNQMKYSLVKSKQMVGIFVTIWARREIVPHIGHLRTSCISRGIMGCLGNKVSFCHCWYGEFCTKLRT